MEGNFSDERLSNFEGLMRAHGARIYTLAVRLTGNIADGQDLAQETFLRAWKSFPQFRGDSDFGTWVYRICLNVWKNRVRYEKRRSIWKHFSLDGRGEDERAPEIAAPDAPAGSPLEAAEREELVRDSLSKLDPEDRAIVIMRDMDDKSYEEIAESLGAPLGTVKSRLARAREKLRNLLKVHL